MAIHQPPAGEPFTLAQLTPPPLPQRRRKKNRTLMLVLAAAAAVAVLAGGALLVRELWPDAPVVGASTFNVTGSITLTDSDGFSSPDATACTGRRGYDDIHAGAQVTVTDAAGTVIALASLEPGRREVGAGCLFLFTVRDVPKGKGFYGVSIGRESRGRVQYSEERLRTEVLQLKLGD